MDIDWVRSAMTVISFATFAGIVVWAWSARKRGDFDVAARSILTDDGGEVREQDWTTSNNEQGKQQ
jgi:cytochrome c oxidase cbb3-type subunit 4